MRGHLLIIIAIGLFLVVNTAGAVDISPSTISSSNSGWLIANGNDVATITVHVLQGSPATDVSGATVAFLVPDADMGTISPATVITGPDGLATAVFTAKTRSGNATIEASITADGGTPSPLLIHTFQRIDHDTAQQATNNYATVVPVGTETPLTITLTDRSDNRIDNLNHGEVHLVHLTMSTGGDSGIWDTNSSGFVSQIDLPTDTDGIVSVTVRVSTVAGSNLIQMDPVGNIVLPSQIYIEGVANSSTPCTLTQIAPSPSSWPADGAPDHYFNLYYSVKDQYGNPVEGTDITLASSAGETSTITTYSGGSAYSSYGPKDISGIYTITATSVSNASILCTNTGTIGSCSQNVEFFSEVPVQMVLSASPQTLVSTDVDPGSRADLRARVMDARGNPVLEYPQGTPVTVSFSQGAVSYPGAPAGGYTETVAPSLSATSAIMGANGFAAVQFIPGKFAQYGEAGYNATATGTCTVTATWTDPQGDVVNRDVTFTWKNYPFLTINTIIDRTYGAVGDFIYITIIIKGDGAALQPKPIDVVLVNDRSGSMLEGYPDRMVDAKTAGSLFRSKLSERDRIGIVSFGGQTNTGGWVNLSPTYSYFKRYSWSPYTWGYDWRNVYGYFYWTRSDSQYECGTNCNGASPAYYDPTAPHQVYLNTNYNNGNPKYYGSAILASDDLAIGFNDQNAVDTALRGIVPGGGTPMREGIYRGVLMADTPRVPASSATPVKAIVLLTDGDWNTGGDPAGGSGAQDLAGPGTGSVITWAKSKGVKIFPIGLGVSSTTEGYLEAYAAETGGNYTSASDSSQLDQIYTNIAGSLIEQASGATTAEINFGANSISVNGTLLDTPEKVGEYLNYSANPPGGLPLGEGSALDSTFLYKFHKNLDGADVEYYRYVRDDTQNWTPAKKLLQFDVGSMRLNDTWQTTFRLNLTKAGQLELFPNCGSSVTFIDSSTGTTQTSCIPSAPVSVYESKVNTQFGSNSLKVENLRFVEGANPDPDIWRIAWDTTYTGHTVAQERITYQSSEPGSHETTYSTISPIYPGTNPQPLSRDIDTGSWKDGYTYTIRVYAEAFDALSTYATITKAKTADPGKIYIKLE
jgi:Mg-chelatase subunit ChlD